MRSLSVLATILGAVALVKGTGEGTCTTTVTTEVLPTSDTLRPTASVGPVAARSSFASVISAAGTLVTSPVPSNPQAASSVGSIFSSVLGSAISGVAASSLPVSFGSAFTNAPKPTVLPHLTGSSLTSLASAIEHSSYPYNFSLGPVGGIKPSNVTTLVSSTATSIHSTSASTTSTSTSSAAATTTTGASTATPTTSATTSAQGSSGAMATAIPAVGGANIALIIAAGVMLLL